MTSILEQYLYIVKRFSLNTLNKEGRIVIYSKVIRYCSENNLSISAFEKLCAIGNGTISRWNPALDKPSKPDIATLEKISQATGMTLADLITGGDG